MDLSHRLDDPTWGMRHYATPSNETGKWLDISRRFGGNFSGLSNTLSVANSHLWWNYSTTETGARWRERLWRECRQQRCRAGQYPSQARAGSTPTSQAPADLNGDVGVEILAGLV